MSNGVSKFSLSAYHFKVSELDGRSSQLYIEGFNPKSLPFDYTVRSFQLLLSVPDRLKVFNCCEIGYPQKLNLQKSNKERSTCYRFDSALLQLKSTLSFVSALTDEVRRELSRMECGFHNLLETQNDLARKLSEESQLLDSKLRFFLNQKFSLNMIGKDLVEKWETF